MIAIIGRRIGEAINVCDEQGNHVCTFKLEGKKGGTITTSVVYRDGLSVGRVKRDPGFEPLDDDDDNRFNK